MQLLNVLRVAAEIERDRQGHGNQPGILTREEQHGELRVGLRDGRDPVPARETHAQKLASERPSTTSEVAIGHRFPQAAPGVVEIESGGACRSVVECFGQRGKICQALRKIVIRRARYDVQARVLFAC